MSARRQTLSHLRDVEINSFHPPSRQVSYQVLILIAACSSSPSLSHIQSTIQQLLYNCCTWYNAIVAAKNGISRSSVCYLRLARASSKTAAASRRISSRCVRSTPCFLYDKNSRIRSSRRATESLLRAAVLILFWAENPRSHSIVCYILPR